MHESCGALQLPGSDRVAPPLRLVVDPDPVRHPRHVVEVGHDLDGVADSRVVEAVRPERVDVGAVHLRRAQGQLHGKVAERPLPRRELGPAVVVQRVLREQLVCALSTEVVCMCASSVVAALLARRHRREQLPILPREPGLAEHDLPVERDGCA